MKYELTKKELIEYQERLKTATQTMQQLSKVQVQSHDPMVAIKEAIDEIKKDLVHMRLQLAYYRASEE